jgi:hypothetical protein
MSSKKNLVFAWASFLGLLLCELFVDYFFRVSSDDFYSSGINEQVRFLIQIIASFSGGYFLFSANKYIEGLKNQAGNPGREFISWLFNLPGPYLFLHIGPGT